MRPGSTHRTKPPLTHFQGDYLTGRGFHHWQMLSSGRSGAPTRSYVFRAAQLSPGPNHGYAILKEVKSLSDGRLQLSSGTLYGAIKRLLEKGWIRRVADPIAYDSDRKRKSYDLTELGRRVLRAQITRLQKLVAVAQIQAVEQSP
jgi:DNA-binding PadR family transcriptional regulator